MENDLTDNKNLAQLTEQMLKKKLTLAVAESCTAGLIQNVISQAENAMGFFQGGITAYNSAQKAIHLQVNPIAAEACNAVSKQIAEQMAIAVSSKFNSEIGLSITGYARTVPAEGINSCFAYIAIAAGEEILLSKKITGKTGATLADNQQIYTEKLLHNLISILNKM